MVYTRLPESEQIGQMYRAAQTALQVDDVPKLSLLIPVTVHHLAKRRRPHPGRSVLRFSYFFPHTPVSQISSSHIMVLSQQSSSRLVWTNPVGQPSCVHRSHQTNQRRLSVIHLRTLYSTPQSPFISHELCLLSFHSAHGSNKNEL